VTKGRSGNGHSRPPWSARCRSARSSVSSSSVVPVSSPSATASVAPFGSGGGLRCGGRDRSDPPFRGGLTRELGSLLSRPCASYVCATGVRRHRLPVESAGGLPSRSCAVARADCRRSIGPRVNGSRTILRSSVMGDRCDRKQPRCRDRIRRINPDRKACRALAEACWRGTYRAAHRHCAALADHDAAAGPSETHRADPHALDRVDSTTTC
jgi:hypothetical protein